MIVAAATVHWNNGFFITNGGWEYNLVIGAAALSIAFTGPGALSLDALAGYATGGIASGVFAAVVGILGAVGQLALRRLSPSSLSQEQANVGH